MQLPICSGLCKKHNHRAYVSEHGRKNLIFACILNDTLVPFHYFPRKERLKGMGEVVTVSTLAKLICSLLNEQIWLGSVENLMSGYDILHTEGGNDHPFYLQSTEYCIFLLSGFNQIQRLQAQLNVLAAFCLM
jgi:hypothetical protein